jgi:hypothetical protein
MVRDSSLSIQGNAKGGLLDVNALELSPEVDGEAELCLRVFHVWKAVVGNKVIDSDLGEYRITDTRFDMWVVATYI